MNAVERQALLEQATPRPWWGSDTDHQVWAEGCCLFSDYYGNASPADAALVVTAVNEHAALLACESGLRALVGFLRPDNAHARHARAALEALDDIRRTA